jgi:LmbE family N-acetylglucosaminyl deacetylase
MPAAVVVSPHLDDAVLSCWSVLAGPDECAVVNVFTGDPDPARERPWDELTGAADPAERQRQRIAEDRAALEHAGRVPTNLGLRPPAGEYAAAHLRELLAAAIPPESEVHLPAAIGGHPAHVLVRDVGLGLAGRAARAFLYADIPYAVRYGWPAWVTGADPDPHQVPVAAWARDLARARLPGTPEPQVRTLDGATAERKLAALREYRSQWPALNGGPLGILEHPAVRGWEVSWQLRA